MTLPTQEAYQRHPLLSKMRLWLEKYELPMILSVLLGIVLVIGLAASLLRLAVDNGQTVVQLGITLAWLGLAVTPIIGVFICVQSIQSTKTTIRSPQWELILLSSHQREALIAVQLRALHKQFEPLMFLLMLLRAVAFTYAVVGLLAALWAYGETALFFLKSPSIYGSSQFPFVALFDDVPLMLNLALTLGVMLWEPSWYIKTINAIALHNTITAPQDTLTRALMSNIDMWLLQAMFLAGPLLLPPLLSCAFRPFQKNKHPSAIL
jgi:hypothetical protein